jgi:hypothetical protein
VPPKTPVGPEKLGRAQSPPRAAFGAKPLPKARSTAPPPAPVYEPSAEPSAEPVAFVSKAKRPKTPIAYPGKLPGRALSPPRGGVAVAHVYKTPLPKDRSATFPPALVPEPSAESAPEPVSGAPVSKARVPKTPVGAPGKLPGRAPTPPRGGVAATPLAKTQPRATVPPPAQASESSAEPTTESTSEPVAEAPAKGKGRVPKTPVGAPGNMPGRAPTPPRAGSLAKAEPQTPVIKPRLASPQRARPLSPVSSARCSCFETVFVSRKRIVCCAFAVLLTICGYFLSMTLLCIDALGPPSPGHPQEGGGCC